jgi:hypothetical protein
MTGNSFNINQQLTSVRLVSDVNLSGIYFNGSLNNGIGATLIAPSNSLLNIDGVNVDIGDRILLPDQTNSFENGIYVVNYPGSSTAPWILERSPDFQSLEQLKLGQYFSVNAGNTFAGNIYVLVEPLPTAIGSGQINFVNVTTGGSGSGGQFLRISNNLSDVSNKQSSFSNIGLGSGQAILLDDSDFIGNPGQAVHLSNPCPNYITIACNTPGSSIYLPPALGTNPDAFALSQGPYIIILPSFQDITVYTAGGSLLTIADSPSETHFVSTDNSSIDGSWAQFNYVSRLNGLDGNLELVAGSNININPQSNGDIVISALSGPSAVTSGQASFYTLNTVTQTTFPSLNTPTPIIVSSVNVLYENNFAITSSSGTPNVQFLTTSTRQCLINAVFTLRSSSVSTQTYSIYIAIKNGSVTTLTNAIGLSTLSPSGSGGPQEISLTYNLALTGPGDNIQFWIANNSTPNDPVVVYAGAVTILDTTQFGGFTSTDVLPQGMNNLYLSQDSGSTYQNVNGLPVTVGDLASFSTTGGKLSDSGILASNVVLNNNLTYGINITGNAATSSTSLLANTATNANNVATNQVSNNANYFPLMSPSSSNTNNPTDLSTGLTYNPSTDILSTTGLALSGIAANNLVATNGSSLLVAASGTYAISISGNAATATTASSTTTSTNATNVSVTDVTTNATFYPTWVNATSGNLSMGVDVGLTYNPNTKILTTTTFSGSLSGNATTATSATTSTTATTATTATNATNVSTTSTGSNSTFYPLFVSSSTNSNQPVNLGTGLTYNPNTNNLTTTEFTGFFNGNATSSTNATNATTATNSNNVATTSTSTNASFYPLFVSSSTNGNQAVNLGTGLSFNPNTNTLIASTFTGFLNGNASSATNATNANTATNANNILTNTTSSNASFYLGFFPSNSSTDQVPQVNADFTVNPSNGILSANNVSIGGITTSNAPLTVAYGGSTAAGHIAYFGSLVGATGGNFYSVTVDKSGFEALIMGVNKNTTTNNIPANAAFISTQTTTGQLAFGRGTGATSQPNAYDLLIGSSGNVTVANNLTVSGLTASSLVTTNGSSQLSSTNTLSSTVLGNVTKTTQTILTSGSGTYTTPANVTSIVVEVWGSAGGGAGCATAATASGGGSGGGGGGYSRLRISSPLSTYAYVIDSGGAGGAAGSNAGAAGGTTTFGTSLLSVTGGGGSLAGVASLNLIAGGYTVGGVGSGGDVNLVGGGGNPSFILASGASSNGSAVSGSGGNSAFGGNGGIGRRSQGAGSTGNFPGGGGGGGCVINGGASVAGGNGAGGMIVVTEFYVG